MQLLQQSVQAYSNLVWPHVRLAELCKQKGDLNKALYHGGQALANVQEVSAGSCYYDLLDIDELINEVIKGIDITNINLQSIQKLYDECLNLRPALPLSQLN